jgi:hypothetical protein
MPMAASTTIIDHSRAILDGIPPVWNEIHVDRFETTSYSVLIQSRPIRNENIETFTINLVLKIECETFEDAMLQTEGNFYPDIESVYDESGEMVWSRHRRNMMLDLFQAVNSVVDVPHHFDTWDEIEAWVDSLHVTPASAPKGSHYIEIPDELVAEMRSDFWYPKSTPDDLLIRVVLLGLLGRTKLKSGAA